MTRQEAILFEKRTYLGKICDEHPHLKGKRRLPKNNCVACYSSGKLESRKIGKKLYKQRHKAEIKLKEQLRRSTLRKTLAGYMLLKLHGIESNAMKRGIDVLITVDDLINQYYFQDGKCAMSGIDLKTDNKLCYRLSVDRINNELSYTPSNIRLILHSINAALTTNNDKELVDICKHIIQPNNNKKCYGLVGRIKFSLKSKCSRSSLVYADLVTKFNMQKGKCAVTGLPFWVGRGLNMRSMSVDKIDPKCGYNIANIRLVLNAVNSLKLDGDDKDMRDIASHIVKYGNGQH